MSVFQSILARLQTAAGVSLAESAGTGVLEIITRCTTQIGGSSVTQPATVRQILAHVGEPTTAPAITPARSPPREANAQQLIAPEAVEAIPEIEFDQKANLADGIFGRVQRRRGLGDPTQTGWIRRRGHHGQGGQPGLFVDS